jgi:imidazolonepropionase-like amidohydrolase
MKENPDKKGDLLWWMAHKKLVKRFNDEGIGLLAGSDIACEGGIPGFTLHEELKHLVDSGLSPLQALQTATINPAKYFDLKSTGQIKENFKADLILLEKNPLKSIKNTLSINKVFKNGKVQ